MLGFRGISEAAISSRDDPNAITPVELVPLGSISGACIGGSPISSDDSNSTLPIFADLTAIGSISGTCIGGSPISSDDSNSTLPIFADLTAIGSISGTCIGGSPISSGYEFFAPLLGLDYGSIAGLPISCGPIASLGIPIPLSNGITCSITFPALTLLGTAAYDVNVGGRAQAGTKGAWQVANHGETGPQSAWGATAHVQAFDRSPWGRADPLPNGFQFKIANLVREPSAHNSRWQDGMPANWAQSTSSWKDFDHHSGHIERLSRWQDGDPVGLQRGTSWQDMDHRSRASVLSKWQEARVLEVGRNGRWQVAKPYEWGRKSRYQEAMRPPPGVSPRHMHPVDPPPELCYTPPTSPIAMIFDAPWLDIDHSVLLFVCENHPVGPGTTIVVPVRRVYMITNVATLTRVDGSIALPVLSMSLEIDMDSWAWGFSATVAGVALDDLQPNSDGDPIELLAVINGVGYRVIAERVARVRIFGKTDLRISGRGRSALLDAPYVPILTFGSTEDRLAQQLANDVLTDAGSPIGWDVDWQLTDWLVPAGAWTKQGTYIDGLKEIAAAAGGYLQPHRTDQEISFLSKYPVAPWDWGTVTPDFELPTAVTQQEGIEWLSKPDYNRVYVSGQAAGVLARITRYGTGGELAAPMVADSLITANEAAEQRGRAILGDTGRQAAVTLRLPVLSSTGIITPGKFVRYVDGSTIRRGLVRSVSVEV